MSLFSEEVLQKIDLEISKRHLLHHPFYQAWSKGMLSLECLQEYAKEYYHHVKAFPTYLSATHSSADEATQEILLQNLIEEQAGSPNHPALWKNFIRALGVKEEEIKGDRPSPSMISLISAFKEICRTQTTAAAVAALYAYESQIPSICLSKIEGLRSFYGMQNTKDWQYFSVHIEADTAHAFQERALLSRLITSENASEVESSVHRALEALNQFLTSLSEKYSLCPC